MSYRVYLELYKNNEKISSHQLFGNNIFPTELREWLIRKEVVTKEELKENEDFFEDIDIDNIETFNEEVVECYARRKLEKYIKTNESGEERFYDDYNAKIINGKKTYILQNLLIYQGILFTSYNLYKWLLEKNALENMHSLNLKDEYKIKISGF
jgi:hypothetical protein